MTFVFAVAAGGTSVFAGSGVGFVFSGGFGEGTGSGVSGTVFGGSVVFAGVTGSAAGGTLSVFTATSVFTSCTSMAGFLNSFLSFALNCTTGWER